MQISAANLLLAGQQAKVAGQSSGPSAFGAALQAKKPEAADGFEALLFKPAAASSPAQSAAPAASGPTQSYTAAKPLGSTIDIRV